MSSTKPKPILTLPYSLVIEPTKKPDFFGFYSPDLHGFTGIGHSIEDCIYQTKHAMKEFITVLKSQKPKVPKPSKQVRIIIQNATQLVEA